MRRHRMRSLVALRLDALAPSSDEKSLEEAGNLRRGNTDRYHDRLRLRQRLRARSCDLLKVGELRPGEISHHEPIADRLLRRKNAVQHDAGSDRLWTSFARPYRDRTEQSERRQPVGENWRAVHESRGTGRGRNNPGTERGEVFRS